MVKAPIISQQTQSFLHLKVSQIVHPAPVGVCSVIPEVLQKAPNVDIPSWKERFRVSRSWRDPHNNPYEGQEGVLTMLFGT